MTAVRTKNFDNYFALLVLVITLFGCLMVYSSSSHYANLHEGDSFYYIKRQLLWLIIALAGAATAYSIGYRRLIEYSPYILFVSALLLIVVLFLPPVRNVHRWIKIGSINFQPSEMARIALILFFALALSFHKRKIQSLPTYIALVSVAAIIGMLIIVEPDIGTTLTLMVSLGFMLFLANSRKTYLLVTAVLMAMVIVIMVAGFGYEQDRINDYVMGLKNPFDSQYQVLQGLLAVGAGGIAGTGLGEGGQKLLFLPEPFSDFIFASIAEETGILLTFPIITVFLLLFLRGCRIARRCGDIEGMLITCGLSAMIVISAFINIGVVLGVLPVTGLPCLL